MKIEINITEGEAMKQLKGYELQRMISKLRMIGMYEDADRLEKDKAINYISASAKQIISKEQR